LIAQPNARYWGIGTAFSPREKGGLLAGIHWLEEDAIPELIVYELPAGTIRARLPLIECPEEEKGCLDNGSGLLADIARQELRWSQDGRYLAFAAVQNSVSSDLYILDSQDGSLRQLTSGPDWVGAIWWSPDGSQLLMEEIVIPWENEQDRQENFYRSEIIPSSLWSVSISDNRLRHLYSIEKGGGCCTYGSAYHVDGPWIWLDDKRFLIYEGASENIDWGLARNLRLVDTGSGETRMLVDFSFYDIDLDEVHSVFAASLPYSIDDKQGVYLISLKNSVIRHLDLTADIDWDEKTGLFVSTSLCDKDDYEKHEVFNYLGELSCVSSPSEPTPPAVTAYPAPDGKLEISAQDGLWLKAEGQDAVRVSPETASNVIWCPDSSCFFFVVGNKENPYLELYHVSLPDLTINLLNKGILSVMEYKLLEKDDSQP
jgi:WD40 repeat protein